MFEWKDGDIYERSIDGGPSIFKVIVKKLRRSAVVLRIYNTPQDEHNFAINVRGEGYVGAGYLYVESASALSEMAYVRALTEKEYKSLLLAVANALGFEAEATAETEDSSAKPKVSGPPAVQAGHGETTEAVPCELISQPAVESIEQAAAIRAERDVYKELVYKMLEGKGRKAG